MTSLENKQRSADSQEKRTVIIENMRLLTIKTVERLKEFNHSGAFFRSELQLYEEDFITLAATESNIMSVTVINLSMNRRTLA